MKIIMRKNTNNGDEYASNEDLRDLGNRIDKRFSSFENTTDIKLNKLSDAQNELKVLLQAAIGEIAPIKVTLSEKTNIEAHNALERRVSRLEDSPNGIRGWLNIAMGALGCLVSFALTVLTIILGFIYFFANYVK